MRKSVRFIHLILFISGMMLSAQSHDSMPLGPSPLKCNLATISANQIMATRNGKVLTMAQLVSSLKNSRIIVVGESHNSMSCHRFQADLIRELHKHHAKIIVGFEFFQRQENDLLAAWVDGRMSEKELLEKVQWYKRTSLNYGYTRQVMDVIKELKLKAIGLNVPRTILRTISRQGFEKLPGAQKKLFPGIKKHLSDHSFFIRSVFGEMAVISDWWFQRVYTAQKGWDIIMAESMLQELSKRENRSSIGIIIAGSNHVKYSLGIPYRLKLRGRKYRVATLIPIHLPSAKKKADDEPENPMLKMLKKTAGPTAIYSRGIGDFVFAVPSPAQSHYPQLSIQGMMQKDGYHISWVNPKGLAKENGLRKGDIIIDLDGHSLGSKETMNKIMATKKWGDTMTVRVFKKINLTQAGTKKTDQ